MTLAKQTLIGRTAGWLLSGLIFIGLMANCNRPPTPSLPASPSAVIRVALLAPASGDEATFGRVMRNGSIMAFDEWNKQGGLLGHRLEWAVYDTDCQFDLAGRATEQAIDDGLKFIVGPLCSEAAIAAAQLAESEQVVMISPTATHPLVTVNPQGETRATVFRASYAYPFQGRAAAHFAYETLGISKAALLTFPRDDYATALSETFAGQFSTLGGEIVYQAIYPPDDIDLREALIATGNSGAELIYLPAAAAVANRVAGQLNELEVSNPALFPGAKPILLGSDRWESAELDLEATAGSYFFTHFVLDDPRPTMVQNWAEAYQATYATEPTTLAALGYDAAKILATAIEQAGTFETMAVVKSLERGTFEGVTGRITFDNQHNPIKPVPVVQIEEGRIRFFTSVDVHRP